MSDFREKYAKEIAEWKAKYGEVWEVVVEDKVAYLRKPSRKELQYALITGDKDNIRMAEIILSNCWLGGDDVIKTNDDYFFGASAVIGELLTYKQAEIKKL